MVALTAERESLIRMVALKDSEVARLKAELRMMSPPPGSVMVDVERVSKKSCDFSKDYLKKE